MIKILFLADTHLGFDLPLKPRVHRRRRGQDFFNNYIKALQPAFNNEVDLVLHGGDLLYRSKVPPSLVNRAFAPLIKIADSGIPVYVVPGNHERSKFKLTLFELHPNLHIFDRPCSFLYKKGNLKICLTGFPFYRGDIRNNFLTLLNELNYGKLDSDAHLLCMHHPVDGAKVGPGNFVFKHRNDTIDIVQIPKEFDVVCSGHIHRQQVLTKNLQGKSIGSPVIYPGSIDRTSFAEKNEAKGYYLITINITTFEGKPTIKYEFQELPTRPMVHQVLNVGNDSNESLCKKLKNIINSIDEDSILRLKITGNISDSVFPVLKIESIRSMAPDSMNISISI